MGGKPTTSLFNSFCNNAEEQVGSFVVRFTVLLGPPLCDSSRYKIVILVGMSGTNLASQADVLGVDPWEWAEKINKSLSTNHAMSHAFLKFLYRAWAL